MSISVHYITAPMARKIIKRCGLDCRIPKPGNTLWLNHQYNEWDKVLKIVNWGGRRYTCNTQHDSYQGIYSRWGKWLSSTQEDGS